VVEKIKKNDNEEEEKRTKRGEGGGEMGFLGSIHKVPNRELRYIQFHYHMKVLKPVTVPLCPPQIPHRTPWFPTWVICGDKPSTNHIIWLLFTL
jgi:hypothetical protein